MQRNVITIKTKRREYTIMEGKPAIVQWKSKNKNRQGMSTAIGWIIRDKDPKCIRLIHSCFQTWDNIEQEYPSSWTIWNNSIIDIQPMTHMEQK